MATAMATPKMIGQLVPIPREVDASSDHPMWLKIDRNNPALVNTPVNVRRSQYIQWFAAQREDFTIVFTDISPFDPPTETVFTVPEGQSLILKISDQAVLSKHYKYAVKDSAMNTLIDPEIVIKN